MTKNALLKQSRAFQVGYANTKHAFDNWGSVNSNYTKGEYAAKLRAAVENCRDKEYANGVLKCIGDQGF